MFQGIRSLRRSYHLYLIKSFNHIAIQRIRLLCRSYYWR